VLTEPQSDRLYARASAHGSRRRSRIRRKVSGARFAAPARRRSPGGRRGTDRSASPAGRALAEWRDFRALAPAAVRPAAEIDRLIASLHRLAL
jgi:hypothetical protein